MVQGGMNCVKYLLFVFNFVFVLSGIALIVVGAVVQSTGREYTEFLGSKFLTAPVLIIVVGCIIFVLAFLGCCGAVKENYCMVVTFGLLLFIIVVVEIAGGITAYVYRGQVEDFVKANMENTLKQQKEDGKKLWDETQQKLKCCGVEGPGDYKEYNITLPRSCCEEKDSQAQCTTYKDGCFGKMKDMIMSKITLVGGVAIGIAVVEILGVIFACCLAAAIKKEYEGV